MAAAATATATAPHQANSNLCTDYTSFTLRRMYSPARFTFPGEGHNRFHERYEGGDNSCSVGTTSSGPSFSDMPCPPSPSPSTMTSTTVETLYCSSDDESIITHTRPPRPPRKNEICACRRNECPICLESLLSSASEKIGVTVPCGHCFHWDCFQEWQSRSNHHFITPCPTCARQTHNFIRIYLSTEENRTVKVKEVPSVSRRYDCSNSSSSTHYHIKELIAEVRSLRQENRKLKEDLQIVNENLTILEEDLQIANEDLTILEEDLQIANEDIITLEMERNIRIVSENLMSSMLQSPGQMISYIFSAIKRGCIHSSDDDDDSLRVSSH